MQPSLEAHRGVPCQRCVGAPSWSRWKPVPRRADSRGSTSTRRKTSLVCGESSPEVKPALPHPIILSRVGGCSAVAPTVPLPTQSGTHRPRYPVVSPLLRARVRIWPWLSIPLVPPAKLSRICTPNPPFPSPVTPGSREQPAQLPRCRRIHRRRWQPAAFEILTTLMCREEDKSQRWGAG